MTVIKVKLKEDYVTCYECPLMGTTDYGNTDFCAAQYDPKSIYIEEIRTQFDTCPLKKESVVVELNNE